MAKPFLILSIDGGGLRGIIPVLILQEIEKITGKRIQDMFHLLAGTSTGGLIACGLSVSDDGKTPLYSLQNIADVYIKRGKDIFPPDKNGFLGLLDKVESIFDPNYNPKGLEKVLTELFGERTMSNCMVPVIACAYDLKHNEPVFFKSRYTIANIANAKLREVCRATSAAPTYFPAYQMDYYDKPRVCIDGGVYINNPGMAAVAEASKFGKETCYAGPDFEFGDIHMLSLGTGTYQFDMAKPKYIKGGLADWATQISDVMMQSVNASTVYECEEMLETGQYMRVTVKIADEKFSNMADSSDATRNYLIDQVKTQVISNPDVMNPLKTFLQKAGVMPAAGSPAA